MFELAQGMSTWSPVEWGVFLGALGLLFGALSGAVVAVIKAVQNAAELKSMKERQDRQGEVQNQILKDMPPEKK